MDQNREILHLSGTDAYITEEEKSAYRVQSGLIYVFVDGYGRMKRSLKPQSVKVPERRFTKTRSAASVSRS